MQQVLVIGGGNTYKTKEEYLDYLKNYEIRLEKLTEFGWKDNLRADLGENFEVILAQMPNRNDAKFDEWKIIFEKITPFLKGEVILIGHSLGGIFLSKYLSENNFPNKIKATFLIAAPFEDNEGEYSLCTFLQKEDLKNFETQGGEIFIYQSDDDLVVPPSDANLYKKFLPQAELKMFSNKGHFNQEHFPELVEQIKKL